LRIERHLARRDTAAALREIDAIVVGYSGAVDAAMQNNASAFRQLAEELRSPRKTSDTASATTKRRKKKRG
ncbi:MAG: hypothetical protein H7X80_10410, partial [bacterium]|nr:hypothetical protein [Candidatus Kapabacteria bacterium]